VISRRTVFEPLNSVLSVIAGIRLIACQPPLREQDVYVSRYFHLSSLDSPRDFFHARLFPLISLLGVMIHLGTNLSLKISFKQRALVGHFSPSSPFSCPSPFLLFSQESRILRSRKHLIEMRADEDTPATKVAQLSHTRKPFLCNRLYLSCILDRPTTEVTSRRIDALARRHRRRLRFIERKAPAIAERL